LNTRSPNRAEAQPRYRLLTTLLDEELTPTLELAARYHQRWAVEAVFDELKTHVQHKRRVLGSKTANLMRQEFYGWVLGALYDPLMDAPGSYRTAMGGSPFVIDGPLFRCTTFT
jgi:hypothetical protein